MKVSEGRVMVTGATRGIGRATVAALLDRGARVVGIATNAEALDVIAAAHPDRFVGIAADLEDTASLEAVAGRATAVFDGVDGLVSSAGIARYEGVGGIAVDSIEAQIRVNLIAPLILAQSVSVSMRDRGGSIVNVSSTLSERVAEMTSVYAATKAGLNTITRCLALELAPYRIRVNAVLPGAVDTEMLRVPRLRPGESLSDDETQKRIDATLETLAALHPLGRLGRPEEIAGVILDVIDRPWQTGSLVTIDGGLSLQ